MNRRKKIVVADLSDVIRVGLVSILKKMHLPEVEIIEQQDSGQLINTVLYLNPDIIIVNTNILGILSIPRFRKEMGDHNVKLVAIQTGTSDPSIRRHYDEVITLGDNVQSIKHKITGLLEMPKENSTQEALSEREKEVLVCVVKGMTNKQIADKLFLSIHTVITHRRNISAKLDIHSAAGLTIYAIVNKLVDLEER